MTTSLIRPTGDGIAEEAVVVEVFADVTCPFAHVGLRRLVDLRARLHRTDVVLRVRSWPLELVNGQPLRGDSVAAKVARLREEVAPDLFVGFDAARFPATSLPALALAAQADRLDVRTGEHVNLALRAALFEEGLDIARPGVLESIARANGISAVAGAADRRAVELDWQEGIARGVLGSPHFFVGERGYFCPTLDIREVDGDVDISFDSSAFAAFIEDIFGR